MPTLTQYWSDEVTRIGNALTNAQAELTALRSAVLGAELDQRNAAALVRSQGEAVAAARRALAAIPMPADGDPLLTEMEAALVALRAAQVAVAEGQLSVLSLRAELQACEQRVQRLSAELATAIAESDQAQQAALARQTLADKFVPGGSLENLIPDALAALAASQADATARVESEFPTHGTASKNFLGRVRARAKLVRDIAASAADVETSAYAAIDSTPSGALSVRLREFVAAVGALQAVADAATQAGVDAQVLVRLAALPALNPPLSYPILTRWQHNLLHDTTKKAKRESTLAKLSAVDAARAAIIPAQVAYDKALQAARKNEPDKTQAELDTSTLSTQRTALDAKLGDLATARNDYLALDVADRQLLDEWFAAVPDNLWDALDALDGAVARLEKLSGSPTPGDLLLAIDTADTALEAALRAAREDARKQLAAQLAWQRANAHLQAERASSAGRASALAHSSVLF